MSRPVRVSLLGQTFTLRTDESDEHMQAVAALVDERLQELLAKGAPRGQNLGLFAALTLADEVLKERQRGAGQRADVRAQIAALEAVLAAEAAPDSPASDAAQRDEVAS